MSKEEKEHGNNQGHGDDKKDTVSIHIDKKENLKSPNPTTGGALYILGEVNASVLDLWREAKGKGDDELIENSNVAVTLHGGDKFYTAQKNLNPGLV